VWWRKFGVETVGFEIAEGELEIDVFLGGHRNAE